METNSCHCCRVNGDRRECVSKIMKGFLFVLKSKSIFRSLLLGDSAVVPQLPDRLAQLSSAEVYRSEPEIIPNYDTDCRNVADVESYLREQEETAILALIDETISSVFIC